MGGLASYTNWHGSLFQWTWSLIIKAYMCVQNMKVVCITLAYIYRCSALIVKIIYKNEPLYNTHA